jgi:hypothetical protein
MTVFSSPSDMDTSDAAADFLEPGLLLRGESATSESEDVPGLSFVFFAGEGLSTGSGVPFSLTGSSVAAKSISIGCERQPRAAQLTFFLNFHALRTAWPFLAFLCLEVLGGFVLLWFTLASRLG